MRVLLTGATGFIGEHVLEELLARGDVVRVLIRPETLDHSDRARQISRRANVELVIGTLTDAAALNEATANIEVVYHLAWQWPSKQSSDPESNPADGTLSAEIAERNVKGTEYLLGACATNHVRRIVYTSSVAVYGPPALLFRLPVSEQSHMMQRDYERDTFTQYYMAPKIAVENTIRCYARQVDLEYVILRPAVVYGPDAPFVDQLVQRTLREPRWVSPDVLGSKSQMVHVQDMVQAVLLAGSASAAHNKEINIAGSETATAEQLKSMIWIAAAGVGEVSAKLPQGHHFSAYEYPRYDITLANTVLKFVPQVALRDGIAEMTRAALARIDPGAADESTGATLSPVADVSDESSSLVDIRGLYDERVDIAFLDEYFEHSGFWNFGYRVHGRESPREACENLIEKLIGLMLHTHGNILDVACGNGATTRHLTKYYPVERVLGINFSEAQLRRCQKNLPGGAFCLMDATTLAFDDNAFDNIICVESAHHFSTRERFLREAYRVLKPGGRLVISDALLPLRAQTQPKRNYLNGVSAYREVCLRAGFAEVSVAEATPECWGGFSADLAYFTRKKLRAGEISLARFYGIRLWLRHLGPERYVLAACLKG
jgi:MPBQ/MSBQ methyltransferase